MFLPKYFSVKKLSPIITNSSSPSDHYFINNIVCPIPSVSINFTWSILEYFVHIKYMRQSIQEWTR